MLAAAVLQTDFAVESTLRCDITRSVVETICGKWRQFVGPKCRRDQELQFQSALVAFRRIELKMGLSAQQNFPRKRRIFLEHFKIP